MGAGLHLLIPPQGSKLWRMAYRFHRQTEDLGAGKLPIGSTSGEARKKREDAKKLVAVGVDPSQQAKLDKMSKRASSASTFGAVADEFLRKIEREGKADATLTKKRWLIDLARPSLGGRPIAEITASEILCCRSGRWKIRGEYQRPPVACVPLSAKSFDMQLPPLGPNTTLQPT